jgi:TctA family transporter
MELLANLGDGFAIALSWQNIGLALLGCFLGTIMGALPGLGPSNGVAILIPLAFTLGLGDAVADPADQRLLRCHVRRPHQLDPAEHTGG